MSGPEPRGALHLGAGVHAGDGGLTLLLVLPAVAALLLPLLALPILGRRRF